MSLLFNTLGNIGVVATLVAYFMLQKGKMQSNGYTYLLLNLCGAGLVIASLFYAWNLPSFLMESAWVLVSAYGLIRRCRKDRVPL